MSPNFANATQEESSRPRLPSIALIDGDYWRRRLRGAQNSARTPHQQKILDLLAQGWRIHFDPTVPHRYRTHRTHWRCCLRDDDTRIALNERTFDALRDDRLISRIDSDGSIEIWGKPSHAAVFDPSRVWRWFLKSELPRDTSEISSRHACESQKRVQDARE